MDHRNIYARLIHHFRYMLGAKVDVKRHKLSHHAALRHAISKIFDGVDGRKEIRSWRMQRYANRWVPSAKEKSTVESREPAEILHLYYLSKSGIKLSKNV